MSSSILYLFYSDNLYMHIDFKSHIPFLILGDILIGLLFVDTRGHCIDVFENFLLRYMHKNVLTLAANIDFHSLHTLEILCIQIILIRKYNVLSPESQEKSIHSQRLPTSTFDFVSTHKMKIQMFCNNFIFFIIYHLNYYCRRY